MTTFLLVLQALIGAALVGVILMQQSEGGGLGMGGSPSGLMSARGAADFLTRATTVLASLFVALSIIQAVRATRIAAPTIDTSLARPASAAPASGAIPPTDPLGAAAGASNRGSSITVPLATDRPAAAPQEVPVAAPVQAPPAARDRTIVPSATRSAAGRTARPATAAPNATAPTTTAPPPPAAATPTPTPAPAGPAATTNGTVPIGGGTGGNSN